SHALRVLDCGHERLLFLERPHAGADDAERPAGARGRRRAPRCRARSGRGRAVHAAGRRRFARMSARNQIVILLGVLTLAAGVYYVATANRSSDLSLIGTVDANQVIVSPKIPGRIERLLVDEGSQVKQGDAIAQLDRAELEAQVRAAQATLSSL